MKSRIFQLARIVLILAPFTFGELGQKLTAAGDEAAIVGVWNGSWTDVNGRMQSQIILRRDGKYQKQDRGLDTGNVTMIYGVYKVNEDRHFLRLEAQGGQSCGINGCFSVAVSESYSFRLSNNNALELRGTCQGCGPWNYRRQA